MSAETSADSTGNADSTQASAEASTETSTTGPPGAAAAGGLVLSAIVGAEFLLQLDGTLVNVALPDVQADLGIGIVGGSWVATSFLLAFGGLLLLSGRIGDALGHRRVFIAGIGLITAASLLAGLAPNLPVLLTGRVLQGLGAALAGPAGLALLTTVFQGERQQRAFGLYSTVTGLGAAAGMVLGGVLTEIGDWRWSLLVNVPVGIVILAVAWRSLRGDAGAHRERSLGLPSGLIATAALVALVFGLVGAAEAGAEPVRTLLPLAIGVVLAVVLLVVDRRAAEPLLPGRIFAHRARAGSFVVLLLLAAVLTGFLLYLVQYLQLVLGLNPLWSGLAILPFGLALLVITQVVTPRLSGVDLKVRGLAGLVLVLGGVLWLSLLDATSTYAGGVLGPVVVLGFGVGLAIVPVNLIILTSSAPEDTGVTAGLLQASLTFGGVLGVAVLLVPYTAGTGDPGETISGLFLVSAAIVVLALLVAAASWFGGARKQDQPA